MNGWTPTSAFRRPAHRRCPAQPLNDALYQNNYENAVIDYLMSNAEFKELPSEITGYYIRMFLNYYNQYATAYGMDLNAFAQTQNYADADVGRSDAYFEHLAKQDLLFRSCGRDRKSGPDRCRDRTGRQHLILLPTVRTVPA